MACDAWEDAYHRLQLINHTANYQLYELLESYFVASYLGHYFLQMLNSVTNLRETRFHLPQEFIQKEQLFHNLADHY